MDTPDPRSVLCFVYETWAYFTTAPLADQWGDDWDDAPYEHNAGEPSTWSPRYDHDIPEYSVFRVAFDGNLDSPCTGVTNSVHSVRDINAGAAPWLATPEWSDERIEIPAGTTYADFVRLVRAAGGTVYEPTDA